MIVKKLRQAWKGQPAGTTVIVQEEIHTELVNESVVDPTVAVRELIKEWEDPDGETRPIGTRVELDASTKAELQGIGALGPTAMKS